MLLPLLLFLFFAALVGTLTYVATASALRGRHKLDGPGPISRSLRDRNRLVVLGLVLVTGALVALEAFVPSWHGVLLDAQYAASPDPLGFRTFENGAGISWALYVSLVAGVLTGLYTGTVLACRRGEGSSAVRAGQIV